MGVWGWGSSTPKADEWPEPPAGYIPDPGFSGMCAPNSITGQMPSTGCPCGSKPVKKWRIEMNFCCKYTECVPDGGVSAVKNKPCSNIG